MKLWTRRIGLVIFLTATLAIAPHGKPASAASPNATGTSPLDLVPATAVIVFHPTGAQAKAVAGSCGMGESLALDRADAWRCMVGNDIYDPCFSTSFHATSVICDASPRKPIGLKVLLPKPLPTHASAQGKQTWMMQLGDGSTCTFITGATFGFNGQRANYGCSDQDWIVGDPVTGRVWLAVKIQVSSKPSPGGPTAARIFAISVATAWK